MERARLDAGEVDDVELEEEAAGEEVEAEEAGEETEEDGEGEGVEVVVAMDRQSERGMDWKEGREGLGEGGGRGERWASVLSSKFDGKIDG